MADCEAGGAVKAQQRLHGNGTGAVRCGAGRVASRRGAVPSCPELAVGAPRVALRFSVSV